MKNYVVKTTDDMEVKQILEKEYLENWGHYDISCMLS
jgi:hypothetical protein